MVKRWLIIIFHVLFWIVVGFVVFYFWVSEFEDTNKLTFNPYTSLQIWESTCWSLLLLLIPFYSFYFFFGKKMFSLKKYNRPFVFFILYSFTYALLIAKIRFPEQGFTFSTLYTGFIFGLIITAISGSSGTGFRMIEEWLKNEKAKEKLEKKQLQTELELLKSQINPHFLFNTLNNIDILIEDEPKKASDFLKKLSEIMRFMLFETRVEKILLQKEISYIEKYIELQKIRTANPCFVKFEVSGSIEPVMIAPMVFIPFIENAFKYASNKKVKNAIDIKIELQNKTVSFWCKNYIGNDVLHDKQNGLGNKLMKQRLELLYPQKHWLHIQIEENYYIVHLEIELHEH